MLSTTPVGSARDTADTETSLRLKNILFICLKRLHGIHSDKLGSLEDNLNLVSILSTKCSRQLITICAQYFSEARSDICSKLGVYLLLNRTSSFLDSNQNDSQNNWPCLYFCFFSFTRWGNLIALATECTETRLCVRASVQRRPRHLLLITLLLFSAQLTWDGLVLLYSNATSLSWVEVAIT